MTSCGYTKSALSTQDIIRHWSLDNNFKLVRIIYYVYLLLLHHQPNAGYWNSRYVYQSFSEPGPV